MEVNSSVATLKPMAGIVGFYITQGARRLVAVPVHRSRAYRVVLAMTSRCALVLHTVLQTGSTVTTPIR
jgi:hypothetical protein